MKQYKNKHSEYIAIEQETNYNVYTPTDKIVCDLDKNIVEKSINWVLIDQ
jgi:hypothetical protein